MRSCGNFNNLFSRDRKLLLIGLSIVMVSVITLTVVYAALLTTLNISGQAEVSSASWDIYLDNVQLNSSSATSNVPSITDARTVTFSTTLSKPGDFYQFTVDVVNNGSIDAMIDSITKTPELSDTQKKYLNYIVEYQNGESINTKQLVSKNSFVRLKVKLEFRKDLTLSDLPTTSEILNLSFNVNYVQADVTGTNVSNNGQVSYEVVSGDLNTVGSEICIGEECFYLMKNNGLSVTMLSKQDITYEKFSTTNYWENVSSYPAYVYNSNSTAYTYVEDYKEKLESQGVKIVEARLIKTEELEELGCSREDENCLSAPSWVYSTSYWTGSAFDNYDMYMVLTEEDHDVGGGFGDHFEYEIAFGIRPVITMAI